MWLYLLHLQRNVCVSAKSAIGFVHKENNVKPNKYSTKQTCVANHQKKFNGHSIIYMVKNFYRHLIRHYICAFNASFSDSFIQS